jgi:hypothetical protein
MKIRTGFVSNSSSSSFIVAVKNVSASSALSKIQEFMNNKDYDYDERDTTIIKTKAALTKSMKDYGMQAMQDDLRAAIILSNGFRKKSFTILDLRISYHDEDFLNFIRTNEDVHIIAKEE